MDMTIECNVSLSKKIRSILGDEEGRVVLIVDAAIKGTGKGNLLISGENLNINTAQQTLGKETNIQFTPTAIKNEVPTSSTVSNIFSAGNVERQGAKTAVDKIAATTPPKKGQNSHAIKSEEEIEIPEAFPEYKKPEFTQFVSNFEELMMTVKAAQGKESEIDVDSIEDPRKKALAIEAKNKAEAIDVPAYVVNDSCSSITLNDLDISLGLNMPFDLANISAKKIAASGDLKSMLKSNVVKFIQPDEVGKYRAKAAEGVEKYGLEAYGSRDEAQDAISNDFPDAEQMDVSVDDSAPNEQEQLSGLVNLTPMGGNINSNVRTSSHGNGAVHSTKTIGQQQDANPQGIKTIARA